MQLTKSKGRYVSADGKWAICASETKRQWELLKRSPESGAWFTFGLYRTMRLAAEALQVVENPFTPVYIRPLRRVGSGQWLSSCMQFSINRQKLGAWIVTKTFGFHDCEQPLFEDWLCRHGLDGFLPSLSEATSRLEKACETDPVDKILVKPPK